MTTRARSGGSERGRPPAPASLDPRKRRAARLLAEGRTQRAAAAAAGVTPRTLRDWARDADYEELVARMREAALALADPVEITLRAALEADLADGEPDWPTRVRAARLLRLPVPGGAPGEERPGATPAAVTLTIRRSDGWLEAVREDTGEAVRHELPAKG